jgi:hypothetical protein
LSAPDNKRSEGKEKGKSEPCYKDKEEYHELKNKKRKNSLLEKNNTKVRKSTKKKKPTEFSNTENEWFSTLVPLLQF